VLAASCATGANPRTALSPAPAAGQQLLPVAWWQTVCRPACLPVPRRTPAWAQLGSIENVVDLTPVCKISMAPLQAVHSASQLSCQGGKNALYRSCYIASICVPCFSETLHVLGATARRRTQTWVSLQEPVLMWQNGPLPLMPGPPLRWSRVAHHCLGKPSFPFLEITGDISSLTLLGLAKDVALCPR